MKNIPYVKQYSEDGILINPIEKSYTNEYPNRKERKQKQKRFHGESKNFHLTVTKYGKFKRVRQIEFDLDGNKKVIENYIQI